MLEKMGWKAGQGLGVNNQGHTDIVKAKLKNDSKGLGFKDNGEEWLKTTSDFDQLLDQLASSAEDCSDQAEVTSSLEDRSKKSKARVHYHKFTRGKDLSRYSEKDLASIIGPDVIKSKNGEEVEGHYTKNQIHKGSLEEYFNNKAKSKHNNSLKNDFSEKTPLSLEENSVEENTDISNADVNSELVSSKKKKKRKTPNSDELNESEIHLNISNNESVNCEDELNQADLEAEVSSKNNRKRKSTYNADINVNEVETNYPQLSDSLTVESPKKKKKKITNCSIAQDELLNDNSKICEFENKISKKKKRSHKVENENVPESNIEQDVTFETTEDFETAVKKDESCKKKKNTPKGDQITSLEKKETPSDKSIVNYEVLINETDNQVKGKNSFSEKVNLNKDSENQIHTLSKTDQTQASTEERTSTKKKRKIKEGKMLPAENDDEYTNNDCEPNQETLVGEELVSKKKKKKRFSHENIDAAEQEENTTKELNQSKRRSKKEKKEEISNEENVNESTVVNEQVNSRNSSGGFLEVLGRRTRLKNIKIPHKLTEDDKYETEDFMSFGTTDNSEKVGTTQDNRVPNSDDQDIPKRVLNYEYKLIMTKLKQLNIGVPPVPMIKNHQHLSGAAFKKLLQSHRIRHYRPILPTQEMAEIDAQVKRFYEDCKSKKLKGDNKHNIPQTGDKVPSTEGLNLNPQSVKVSKKDTVHSNENDNRLTLHVEPNSDDCNIPKHVIVYEYRLVAERIKQLNINSPEMVLSMRDPKRFPKATYRKLRQLYKSRHLKTLLPPEDLTEIEASVKKFFDDLKPKIEMIEALVDLEKKAVDIAEEMGGQSGSKKCSGKENEKSTALLKSKLSEKIDVLKNMSQQLELLVGTIRNTSSESLNNISKTFEESSSSKGKDDPLITKNHKKLTSEEEINQPRSLQKRVEEKLNVLSEQMKMLAEGKKPVGLTVNSVTQTVPGGKREGKVWSTQARQKNSLTNNFKGRGRMAHNVSQRGRGAGRGQLSGMDAVPFGGWGVLQSYGTGPVQDSNFSSGGPNFRGGFSRGRGFIANGRGGFDGGRGFIGHTRGGFGGGRGFIGHTRGGFDGGYFMGQASYGFGSGRGFMGRGRVDFFRGRGRGDMSGRGRISQNNFDAKLYAEKCKELNKLPEVCFNGVNLKGISGYAANVNTGIEKNNTVRNENSKVSSEIQKIPGEFSEVVVKKDKILMDPNLTSGPTDTKVL